MKKNFFFLPPLISCMVILCTISITHAMDINVRDESALPDAIDNANDGTYDNIIFDARDSSDGVFKTSTPMGIAAGNSGLNTGYGLSTFHDSAVTLQGDGSDGLFITGDNDTSPRETITIDNLSFDNFDTAIFVQDSYVDFGGRGDVRFSNNNIAMELDGTASVTPSMARFQNLGNVIFENGRQGIINTSSSNQEEAIQFLNGGHVIFRNLDSGFEFYGNGSEVIFRNRGDVTFEGNTYLGFIGSELHTVDFNNSGNVSFFNNNDAIRFDFADNTHGNRVDRFNNQGDTVFVGNYGSYVLGVSLEGSENYLLDFTNTGDTVFQGNHTRNSGGGVRFSNSSTARGDISFSGLGNTYFHNNFTSSDGGGIYYYGRSIDMGNLTFAPTGNNIVEFKNNWQNVSFNPDGSADLSNAMSNSLFISRHGNVVLTPSANASILFRDPIIAASATKNNIKIIQNGNGTVRLWNGMDNSTGEIAPALLGGTVILENGRFLAMQNAVFTSGLSSSGQANLYMTTKSGATLGFSVDRDGGHSSIITESFDVENGAHLYVSDISSLDAGTQFRDYQDVVTSTDAIGGSFATMKVDNNYMSAELVQNGNYLADLHVNRVNTVESQLGSRAAFLDEMRINPDLPEVIRWELDDLYHSGTLTPEAMELFQIASGTDMLNALNATRTNARLFHQMMVSRMDDLNDRAGSYRRLPAGHLLRLCSRSMKNNQLWGAFSYNRTKQDASFLRSGYSYRPYSFNFGKDHYAGPWRTGFAFQYAHGTTRSGDHSYTNTESDTATFGVYAGRHFGKNYLKMTAQAGLGYNESDTHYGTLGLDSWSHFISGTLGAGFELGRVIRLGCETHPWDLTPHVGAEYQFIASESFQESGGKSQANQYGISAGHDLTRGFQGVRYNVVEIPIGLRIARTIQISGGVLERLRPNIDLMYVRSAGDNVASSKVRFLSSPASPWSIDGSNMGRDAFRMNLGIGAKFVCNWDLDLNYGLESRSRYNSQEFVASLTKSW